ncbi:group II intron reverse transcriptase/maturase [Paenibacillus sp. Y412MC10]|uniref:group II intron reverse transcriptase/maturase n=1 Tax=Geobacillus sp. (strain Y412MC10) TaxID=481743 RepID=UPI0011AB41E2|nr:group II intron reverse transcriptase/maturase [Paenibacillus sp. Y412MC10]
MDEKRTQLRHNEYYGTQDLFDALYSRSLNGNNFYNLVDLISSESNIRLAYRNIKKNKGSSTAGTDGLTIKDISTLQIEKVILKVQSMLSRYEPSKVRRVFIPKPNGEKRPLGIPAIWDRLVQQCILQILEPIFEAKFHQHSYGFRPNRNTHHAIERMCDLVGGKAQLHYCVDIDIKGFFDNVNHSKLLKQLWTLGIRDKSLLSIISRLLKAEIEGEGTPSKGTPQGGILSPLLSNIVLNELDWWISDQWETFETRHPYKQDSHRYRALKRSSGLKECRLVRYADDFKVLCRDYNTASKVFHAVKDFLWTRLGLEISPTKSKIVNLRKQNSEFLGISIKTRSKGKNIVSYSRMTEKAKRNAREKIKQQIISLQRHHSRRNTWKYNMTVMGIQNYYSIATRISDDMAELNSSLRKILRNKLCNKWKTATPATIPQVLSERYKGYKHTFMSLAGIALAPVYAQKWVKQNNFNQNVCSYTQAGRALIHKPLRFVDAYTLKQVREAFNPDMSIEFNDNRISKFVAQQGKCFVTGEPLHAGDFDCHHILPRHLGGGDNYQNLTILSRLVHKLVHLKDSDKIAESLTILNLSSTGLKRLNDLRRAAKNSLIELEQKVA